MAQESAAGAGDFGANVLGFVSAFNTPRTAAAFYQYNNPDGSSYNGQLNGGPNPVSSLSQAFLVDRAAIEDVAVGGDAARPMRLRWRDAAARRPIGPRM